MSRPEDRAPRWRFNLASVAVACTFAILVKLASMAPGLVEQLYTGGYSVRLTTSLALATAHMPFSVFEVLLAVVGLWLLLPGIPALYRVVRKRRHFVNAMVCEGVRTLGFAGVAISVFYAVWGLNYARADLPERIGWDDSTLATLPRLGTAEDREELVALCTQLTFVTNFYYEQAMGTRDAGQHSRPRASIADLDRSLDVGYQRAAALLGMNASFARSRGPPKPVRASRLMSTLGIAGFYSPWTGEANYNREMPPHQLPLTIAHEKAHQRCVTSEDEANFMGYLACILSDDPYARYSGYLFAQGQLLRELLRVDPQAARAIMSLRYDGVQQDVYYGRMYWVVFRGALQSASLAVNNAYLRANRVEGGLVSYQRSARLLVLFSRYNEGTCVIPMH